MATEIVSSWGNVLHEAHGCFQLAAREAALPDISPATSLLPYGNGRSYGDSCLNAGAALLRSRNLDRFISFDRDTGVLTCESGALLADILRLVVPAGWFVPVSPGTRFVTVGGAIANDIHGKNHHHAGTFIRHVRRFELVRSDGSRMQCSPQTYPDWFAATAGGLGLTGFISWAEISLKRIAGPWMDVETIRYGNLDEFVALCAESDRDFEYTVSWVDCLGSGRRLGRGLFQRANHAAGGAEPRSADKSLGVPFAPPFSLVNPVSLRAFNTLYYHRQWRKSVRSRQHYQSFFYPLDGIRNWNRLYGPRGLYQYQCVIPGAVGRDATAALLQTISRSGLGSFLAVLKVFGAIPSPGLLSFPREGITLALDFPNRGARLERLFRSLDAIVAESGGRLYPAKDGRMPGPLFRQGYPRLEQFRAYVDPRFSSSFWRRVMAEQA